jgi:quercetin dioxygenase-like cupin family protein
MSAFLPLGPRERVDLGAVWAAGWDAERRFVGGTVFGMVTADSVVDGVSLAAGCWFVAPDGCSIGGGRGLAVGVPGYRGIRQLGGPIEATGRLAYIDGCTDTLLVCPPRLGEPCLNHLHLPAGTDQTPHTHPSVRIGVIVRGRGWCRAGEERWPLAPGLGFVIPEGAGHSFVTDGESLDVLAWHPDSDFGPTDHDHPMVNRTIR